MWGEQDASHERRHHQSRGEDREMTLKKHIHGDCCHELRDVLDRCVGFLAALNGQDWIEDKGPGGIDMRQRAKSLQRLAYNAVAWAERDPQEVERREANTRFELKRFEEAEGKP
jgi:hypothetical protein